VPKVSGKEKGMGGKVRPCLLGSGFRVDRLYLRAVLVLAFAAFAAFSSTPSSLTGFPALV